MPAICRFALIQDSRLMIPFARTGLKPWTYFVMNVGNVGLPYSSKWKGLRLIQSSPLRALLESRRTKRGLLNSSLVGFRASTVEGEAKWESANIAEPVQECLEINILTVQGKLKMNGPLPLLPLQK